MSEKKIIVKVDASVHRELKILAAMRGVTLSELIRLLVRLNKKDQSDVDQYLNQ